MSARRWPALALAAGIACAGDPVEDDDDAGESDLLGLLVTPQDVHLPVGGSAQLSATGLFEDHDSVDLTSLVRWRVSDVGVVRVSEDLDEEGLATGISVGDAVVWALYEGLSSTTISVTVVGASGQGDAFDTGGPTGSSPLPAGGYDTLPEADQ